MPNIYINKLVYQLEFSQKAVVEKHVRPSYYGLASSLSPDVPMLFRYKQNVRKLHSTKTFARYSISSPTSGPQHIATTKYVNKQANKTIYFLVFVKN